MSCREPFDSGSATGFPEIHGGFFGDNFVPEGVEHQDGALPDTGGKSQWVSQETPPRRYYVLEALFSYFVDILHVQVLKFSILGISAPVIFPEGTKSALVHHFL